MALDEKPQTELDEELEERWEDAPGIPGFFNSVDHKRIGLRYIYTAFVFFFIAGLLALVMRVQLAEPDARRARSRHVQPVLHDARHRR